MRRKTVSEIINGKIESHIESLNTIAIAKIESIDNAAMMCNIKLLDMPEIMGTRDEVETIENVPVSPIFWGNKAKMNAPLSIGDKVIVAFCQHDTFNARNSNEPVEAETYQKFDFNNAIVIAPITSDSESSPYSEDFYILYGGNVIRINESEVEIKAPNISLNGNVNVSGTLDVTSDIKTNADMTASGKSFLKHTNGGLKLD